MILHGEPVAEAIRKTIALTPQKKRTLTVVCDQDAKEQAQYLRSIRKEAVEWGVEIRTAEHLDLYDEDVKWMIDLTEYPIVPDNLISVDGQSHESAWLIYTGSVTPESPCTPEAILWALRYHGIPLDGKKVVILGRGEKVGKPFAMLALRENATVAICHSHTSPAYRNTLTQAADIIVCATGSPKLLKRYDVHWGATVINVGGDYDETTGHEGINLIPYKGGIGAVTPVVLMAHVVSASEPPELY